VDRQTFAERLHSTSVAARDLARSFVLEALPDEMLFRVRLSQSYDKNPLHPDELVYPEDSGLNLTAKLARCNEGEVVDLLWRENRVPEWVDISVVAEIGFATILGLRCCGRFTGNEQLLYHTKEGRPPFHACGPALPPNYQNGQRFSIYTRSEALSLRDVEALKPHSEKVLFLELLGQGCNDLTLNSLPQLSGMQVLDLTRSAINGSGLSALDRQPSLRALKVFVDEAQTLDLDRLPRLPLLNSLMIWNAPSLNFDFGIPLPRLPSINDLDMQIIGNLKLDGGLPGSMWTLRLRGRNLTGTLSCPEEVEHLSLQFAEGNESELVNFVRLTKGVKFLNLETTPVSDKFVKDVVNRWPLEYLNISSTNVSEELVTELTQLRPKLRVVYRGRIVNSGPASRPTGF
jgi:hypothetical protein